jgi:signal transduction histidine kinase
VEDDGTGFDPAAVPSGRFGLVGMSERARLLGGTLRLESSPGAGTVIDVTVPE